MSARIAPEPIGTVVATPVEYRPAPTTHDVRPVDAGHGGGDALNVKAGPAQAPASGAAAGEVFAPVAEVELPPPPPPPEPPGRAYVRAVIAGALSPRPTSAQELFTRVGTGWVPPESEYRLADKTI